MKPNWFIAVPITDTGWLGPLLADAPPGVRRFVPADLHMTVAFLGACAPEAAHAAWETCAGLALPSAVASARLGELVPMGGRRRPSAYALSVSDPAGAAAALIAAWRDPLLEAAGAPPDHRPPRPHVTVARPPRRASDAVYAQGAAWLQAQPPLSQPVVLSQVALYTWSADRRGRLFDIVAQRPLDAD